MANDLFGRDGYYRYSYLQEQDNPGAVRRYDGNRGEGQESRDGSHRYDGGHGNDRGGRGDMQRYGKEDGSGRNEMEQYDNGRGSGRNDRDNRDDRNDRGGNGNRRGQNRQNLVIMLLATIITLVFITYFMGSGNGGASEVSYNEFIQMVEDGKVSEVDFESDRLTIHLKGSDATRYTAKTEDDTTVTQRLLDAGVTVKGYVADGSSMVISILLSYVLPIVILWILMGFVLRRMGGGGGLMGSVGKSTAKEYVQKDTGVTFQDVAGEDEAKESLAEVVDFLHNPGRYARIGAKLPKGALLVGPPGTGKTLLAKAVAGEARVPFFSLTGSDFIELYVGVGASRVRDLFKEASKNAPCIIFIDEIDAIGRSRDSKYGGGNEEREQTLNQLLSEMDGFEASKGILVIGATNRPEILDKALLRPGRFDRRIIVDRPDLKGRIAILKVHARDVKMDETVNLEEIALATSGAVGSDLANMINEAAINAVKNHRQYVNQKDLFEAVEQVLVGKEKKDRVMNQQERRIVSYHEVGHALISAVQKNSEPVQKITIVPRTMGALGYVMQVPEEEKYLNTKAELHDMIVGLLGGRAAEELKFETVTTGASNDIERATQIARNMVTQYGMSDRFGLMGLASVESQYLEGRTVLNCSDVTAAAVDEEVRKIVQDCYNEAKKILSQNMEALDKIAEYLIRQETITGKEFMKLYREVKGEADQPEQDAAQKLENDVKSAESLAAAVPRKEESAESKAGKADNAGGTGDSGGADNAAAGGSSTAAASESSAVNEESAGSAQAGGALDGTEKGETDGKSSSLPEGFTTVWEDDPDISRPLRESAAEGSGAAADTETAQNIAGQNEKQDADSHRRSVKGRFSQASLDSLTEPEEKNRRNNQG